MRIYNELPMQVEANFGTFLSKSGDTQYARNIEQKSREDTDIVTNKYPRNKYC